MIPWPIGLLALWYGAVAALAARSCWMIMSGMSSRPLVVHLAWLVLSAGATMGLLGLKPWGRQMAIWTSILLMVVLLAVSGMLVLAAKEHGFGFLMAMLAAAQMLPIRYLRLPKVKTLFRVGG